MSMIGVNWERRINGSRRSTVSLCCLILYKGRPLGFTREMNVKGEAVE